MRFAVLLLVAVALAGCGSSQSASSSSTGGSSVTLAQNHVHSIVIMPHNPNVLYLGAHYKLYKSTDGGATWHPLTGQMMLSLALDPAHPSTLYAVSSKRGLEKTTDGGRHWKRLAVGGPSGQITGVVFDPVGHIVLAYGLGIHRSVDGGAHWSTELPGKSIGSVAVGSGRTAYASSTEDGIYVSHDGGVHWKRVASIGNQPAVQVVAAQHVAYAVAAIGVFKSANDGRTWNTLAKAPTNIQFLGMSPTDPNEVFGEVGAGGFVASHDGGATWHAANAGLRAQNFSASTIRVAPSSPKVVYTGSWGLHFYASHDGGYHWVQTATLTR